MPGDILIASLADQGFTAQTVADQLGAFQAVINGIIGVVMLIAFLAGTPPAARAARQNPIEALRYE